MQFNACHEYIRRKTTLLNIRLHYNSNNEIMGYQK